MFPSHILFTAIWKFVGLYYYDIPKVLKIIDYLTLIALKITSIKILNDKIYDITHYNVLFKTSIIDFLILYTI